MNQLIQFKKIKINIFTEHDGNNIPNLCIFHTNAVDALSIDPTRPNHLAFQVDAKNLRFDIKNKKNLGQ